MLAVTLTRADGELALVWRSAAHLGHRPDWGVRAGGAWGLVGCGRRERGMAGLSPGRTDASHGCPVWDRPSWDRHPSLEKLSPVLWPCPAQAGRRFMCAYAGGPGRPLHPRSWQAWGQAVGGGAGLLHLLAASHFVPALYVLPVLNIFFFKYISGKAVFSLLSCQVCVHSFRQ